MGAVWLKRSQLIGSTSEVVGYKSGLGLSRQELDELIPAHLKQIWFGQDYAILRIRAEEYEDLIAQLLFKVGNTPTPSCAPFGVKLLNKYKNDPHLLNIYTELMPLFIDFLKKTTAARNVMVNKSIDPSPFVDEAEKRFGLLGQMIALEILKGFNLQQHINPWGLFRQVDWLDTAQLRDLFESESLMTLYGRFIDQRYIDFLSHNFDFIGKINWRKFEALTCEFFERQGYLVEIGEGRGDDGVDARVWAKGVQCSGPPTILVQCKRHQSKIEKMVVKSLWADIVEEKASSGLIVTTSSLSPGAEKVCTARSYPIGQVNRNTLKSWIEVMRTPYKGVFLAE